MKDLKNSILKIVFAETNVARIAGKFIIRFKFPEFIFFRAFKSKYKMHFH